TDGAVGDSLSRRLFKARLELIHELDRRVQDQAHEAPEEYGAAPTLAGVRRETAELLQAEVAAMNVNNFVVRPKRRLVETYAQPEAWMRLTDDAIIELSQEVAGLPTEQASEPEEVKRFDLLLLHLQLDLLRGLPGFERLRDQVKALMGLLEEKAAIPMVNEQMDLIQDLQTDQWWQDVTVPMLETVRRRIRLLVPFIEKHQRKPIYTDFKDEVGPETEIEFVALGGGPDFERFRAKARQFLLDHQHHLTIHKLRWNKSLTETDLSELERMLVEAGVGSEEDLAQAKAESNGLGLFIRSLVGLDREAAKRAFADFLSDTTVTANQIEFINLIIDHLTEHGVMDPGRLYESPFIDISPSGPEGLFTGNQVDQIVLVLEEIRQRAVS
ncbi:MAG: type I restriction-modification enzyme R subunit C-terminal domain-containing protein, partial [Bacillota bacterium]